MLLSASALIGSDLPPEAPSFQSGGSSDQRLWQRRDGRLTYNQPGKPQQNAYVERYNRTVRHEWLGLYIFDTIEEVQQIAFECNRPIVTACLGSS